MKNLVERAREEVFSLNLVSKEAYENFFVDNYYGDNDIAKHVIRMKYLCELDGDNLVLFWYRIAKAVASVEDTEAKRLSFTKIFFDILKDFSFVPGGRIMFAAGNVFVNSTYQNCYVNPIKNDSLEAIYSCLYEMAQTYSKGGGEGTCLSVLRPKNAFVSNSVVGSPGATSFMDLFSISTSTIAQNGRRGALLLCIDDWHPDVESFINIKNDGFSDYIDQFSQYDFDLAKDFYYRFSDRRKVSFANISVKFSDKFMQAVLNDEEWELKFPDYENHDLIIEAFEKLPEEKKKKLYFSNLGKLSSFSDRKTLSRLIYDVFWYGDIQDWESLGFPVKVYYRVKARDIFDKFIFSAHSSSEPGALFIDRVKENWTMSEVPLSPNPCGEQFLDNYSNCLLGHVNLFSCWDIENRRFNYSKYRYLVRMGVRFLDNVVTLGIERHALKEQRDKARMYRRIGLGITGLADLFLMQGITYGDKESLEMSDELGRIFMVESMNASIDLAAERGSYAAFSENEFMQSKQVKEFFSVYPDIYEKFKQNGIRNVMLSSIAPVGTGSIIAELLGSGIEPVFAYFYNRRVKNPDGETYQMFKVSAKAKCLKYLNVDWDNMPAYFVSAYTIDAKDRVQMQSMWQKYIMNAISSTCNLPKNVDKETVKDLFILAWQSGLKGFTIYRDGSRAGILITE